MSWTTPRTWVDGEVETASILNTHIRDNLNLLATTIDTAAGATKFLGISSSYVLSYQNTLKVENVVSATGNNSGTGETDLASFTLPGATLANNGGFVRITSWGTTSNSANVKIVKHYFGVRISGFSGMFSNSTSYNWHYRSTIFRTGAATQTAFTVGRASVTNTGANSGVVNTSSPGQTLSGTVVCKTTGQGGASNEVACFGQIVEGMR